MHPMRSLLLTALLPTGLLLIGTSFLSAEGDGTRPVVLFLGDSLTAGYGVGEAAAFPRKVGELLEAKGLLVEVVNAGVSGDTSAGGLARIDWLLRMAPAVVVLELGANDGLRGLDLEMTESNLREMIDHSRQAGAVVLLLGMRMPPNYGEYATEFAALYEQLATELELDWVPFLLEGVGGDPTLNLPDGIHPNVEGQEVLAETVAPALERTLRAIGVE